MKMQIASQIMELETMAHSESRLSIRHLVAHSRTVSLSSRLALWKSRRDLAALDDRALADIGVSSADAAREARLSVWDVPANWRCK